MWWHSSRFKPADGATFHVSPPSTHLLVAFRIISLLPFLLNMDTHSAAQHIPRLVGHSIISHVLQTHARSPPHFTSVSSLGYAKYPALVPLLHVCQSWRSVALQNFYQQVNLILGQKWELRAVHLQTPTAAPAVNGGFSLRVKQAVIRAKSDDLLQGLAAVLLSRSPFSNMVFLNVTQLSIQVNNASIQALRQSEGALRFCVRISEMFPRAVVGGQDKLGLWNDIQSWYSDLIHHNSRSRQNYYMYSNYMESLVIAEQLRPSLTSISLGAEMFDVHHIEFVKRNAETLESLCLFGITHNLCRMIIQDTNSTGTHIFPNVKHLEVHMQVAPTEFNYVRDAPLGEPFPKMRKLVCMPFYPFSNDVLFRGNQATLETLAVPMDFVVADALKDSPVLEGSYLNLDYVHMPLFWPQDMRHRRHQDTTIDATMLRVALQLSQTCVSFVFGLNGDFKYSQLHASLEQYHGFTRLRTFDICTLWLTPKEMLQMVQLLPTVRRLYVSLRGSVRESRKNMAASDIEQEYGAFKGVSGSNLRHLHVLRSKRYTRRQLTERLLAAASLIPTIKRVSVYTHTDDDLVARVRHELSPEIPWTHNHLDQVDIYFK